MNGGPTSLTGTWGCGIGQTIAVTTSGMWFDFEHSAGVGGPERRLHGSVDDEHVQNALYDRLSLFFCHI